MSDDSLFREVDEDVRNEEMKRLWERYGTYFVAVALGVILAVSGLKGWQYYRELQAEVAAKVFFTASKLADDGRAEDAIKAFEALQHPGFARLGALRTAALLGQAGKAEAAVKLYDGIALATDIDPALRDLARIRAAYLLVDTLKPDELLARIGAYDTEASPWRNAAREIFGLAAWRVKDHSMAARYMAAIIADPAATPDMRKRAGVLSQLLEPLTPR